MAEASIEGSQACPKGLRHGFGIAAVAACVPLPTIAIAAALGHANLQTTAAGLEVRDFLARMWAKGANSACSGACRPPEQRPVARMAWAMTRKVGPPRELRTLPEPQKWRFWRNSGGSRL